MRYLDFRDAIRGLYYGGRQRVAEVVGMLPIRRDDDVHRTRQSRKLVSSRIRHNRNRQVLRAAAHRAAMLQHEGPCTAL
jgi:hypothetical protein